MPFFLFIIFTVYTMLPFGMRDAVIISVLSALSHIIVLSVLSRDSHADKRSILFQVRKSYFKSLNILVILPFDFGITLLFRLNSKLPQSSRIWITSSYLFCMPSIKMYLVSFIIRSGFLM